MPINARTFSQLSWSSQKERSASQARKPIKRALIIGIKYEGKAHQLRRAHGDARRWVKLCKDKYGFQDSDITLMLDHPAIPPHLQPTRDNMETQMKELVKGIQPKDVLMFFYAGHSGQVDSIDTNEDDGKDEYIIAVDDEYLVDEKGDVIESKRRIILDNDLREWLVNDLPVRCSLTAVFDSCHSGTLLDLDHYECNNVWLPILSRGRRNPKRSLWLENKRKNGHDMRDYGVKVLERRRATDGDIARLRETRQVDFQVQYWKRIAPEKLENIRTALESQPCGKNGRTRFELFSRRSLKSTLAAAPTSSHCPTMPLPGQEGSPGRANSSSSSRSIVNRFKNFALEPLLRCTSPEELLVRKCTGQCETTDEPGPRVISLSACRDPEQTWEGPKGCTMTRTLVEILERDPHPPCLSLAQELGHKLYNITHRAQARNVVNMMKRKNGEESRVYDVDYSAPQLGSLVRLTSEDRFMQ
ncbi:caspase domain-containing protein [Daedaleopsis nitida]|nr:caspase domain-containing protein [Daedaleopsis nitida]